MVLGECFSQCLGPINLTPVGVTIVGPGICSVAAIPPRFRLSITDKFLGNEFREVDIIIYVPFVI